MTLNEAKTGDNMVVIQVCDEHAWVTTVRFGIVPGQRIKCTTHIPYGPVIITVNKQEIAVGQRLARNIEVRKVI